MQAQHNGDTEMGMGLLIIEIEDANQKSLKFHINWEKNYNKNHTPETPNPESKTPYLETKIPYPEIQNQKSKRNRRNQSEK